jgi:tripartite-type tricarboxylate transporter receptor subunit TctC
MTPLFHRRRWLATTAALGLAPLPLALRAQAAYPDKPVRLVVGFAPGTGPDVLARHIAAGLGGVLKQQVTVDNRTGAGGQIAAQNVAKSPADGYHLLLGDVSAISIAPAAFSKLPYDPAKELLPVSEVARSDFLLVVPANAPARTVAEFVQAQKARDRADFATFGAGTPGHFAATVFGEMAGFKVEPIHYRATGDAVTAIVAGDVAGAFVSTALGVAQVKGGKMRALATTAAQRSPLAPDVPTFTEAGMPKMDVSAWFAVFAPTGTPQSIVDLLNRQLVATVQAAETRAKLVESGFSVSGTSAADTLKMVRADAQKWGQIVKASGFKGD